jgi:hypothetical protein
MLKVEIHLNNFNKTKFINSYRICYNKINQIQYLICQLNQKDQRQQLYKTTK